MNVNWDDVIRDVHNMNDPDTVDFGTNIAYDDIDTMRAEFTKAITDAHQLLTDAERDLAELDAILIVVVRKHEMVDGISVGDIVVMHKALTKLTTDMEANLRE